ncbi:hypothetical protein VIBNIPon4_840015 [Vibrio nigripulchritudo POn4]|nr:hypothetical protein VIBNIPon4_840015 [Vibrio nigripulchritudo POn4]
MQPRYRFVFYQQANYSQRYEHMEYPPDMDLGKEKRDRQWN